MQERVSLGDGRYPIRGTLGSGGMASVFLCFDETLQVERAVKVLAPHLAGNDGLRTRFLNEARTMARLRHRNIVTVYEVPPVL